MATGQSGARLAPGGCREPAPTPARSRGERENRRQPAGESRVAAAVITAAFSILQSIQSGSGWTGRPLRPRVFSVWPDRLFPSRLCCAVSSMMQPAYGALGEPDSRGNGALACRFGWRLRVGVFTDTGVNPPVYLPPARMCLTAVMSSSEALCLVT